MSMLRSLPKYQFCVMFSVDTTSAVLLGYTCRPGRGARASAAQPPLLRTASGTNIPSHEKPPGCPGRRRHGGTARFTGATAGRRRRALHAEQPGTGSTGRVLPGECVKGAGRPRHSGLRQLERSACRLRLLS